MEGLSVIVPCYNKVELTRDCAGSFAQIKFPNIEFIFVDNGSTDDTVGFLKTLAGKFRYCQNQENIGLIRAFNQGASHARYGTLVFMHNDVIIHDMNWPDRIADFFKTRDDTGIVGVYGARKIRKDGSFLGRGIVHSKVENGNLKQDYMEVAVVDGLFMAMKKEVYGEMGKFDERYTMHYYDKDISLEAHKRGYRNYVLNVPFTHVGAGTRSTVETEADAALRDEMNCIFVEKWKNYLPLDVRTTGERIKDWVKKYV
jgi:GT2 family glycosyltransferase